MTRTHWLLVEMDWKHIGGVAKVDKECFPDVPLTRELIEEQLRESKRWTATAKKRVPFIGCIVAAIPTGGVLGYCMFEVWPHHAVLCRFGVASDKRRYGIASDMMAWLKDNAASIGLGRLACDVGDGDLPAQVFLRSCGFEALRPTGTGRIEGCYRFVWRVPSGVRRSPLA